MTSGQADDGTGDGTGDGDGDGDGDAPPHACGPYLSWDGQGFVDIDECAGELSPCGEQTIFTCINREGSPPTCAWDATGAYAALTVGVNEIPGFVGPPNASALVLLVRLSERASRSGCVSSSALCLALV